MKQNRFTTGQSNNDSNNIYWFFVDGLPYVIVNVITFTGIIVLMLFQNISLLMITIVTIPVIFTIFRLMWRAFRQMHHRRWVYDSKMSSHVSDTLNGQRIIKAFSKEREKMAVSANTAATFTVPS